MIPFKKLILDEKKHKITFQYKIFIRLEVYYLRLTII
jgi:hypothetical protein